MGRENALRQARRRQLRAEVESEVARLGRTFSGSDFVWDALEYMYLLGQILLPLRKQVRRVARKYANDPAAYHRAFSRLGERYWRRKLWATSKGQFLVLRFRELGSRLFRDAKGDSLGLAPDVSLPQLQAIRELLPIVGPVFQGLPLDQEPNRVYELSGVLMAKKGGRPRNDSYDMLFPYYEREKGPKKAHKILLLFDPKYLTLSDSQKKTERRKLIPAMSRRRKARSPERDTKLPRQLVSSR